MRIAEGGLRNTVPGNAAGKETRTNCAQQSNPHSAFRNQPLIVNHEILTLPSASTLAVLRRELAGRPLAPKTLAMVADPVFESADERVKAAQADKALAQSQPSAAPTNNATRRDESGKLTLYLPSPRFCC